jgi:iron complex outermembrane receptor protein
MLRKAWYVSWLLLAVIPAAAIEEPPEKKEEALREEVTVTANSEGIVTGPRGASTSIVDPSSAGGMPSSLTELVAEQPGISENGMGGHSQVVSIRGVSRHRITSMLSGMRLSSERRAGVSFSFLDPLLMGSVQVLRGPATSFYGSGALGGVMQVFPRTFKAPFAEAGFSTNGNENYQLAGIGSEGWSVAVARRSAGDGEAADGGPLNTHFTQYSAVLQRNWNHGPWRYELLAVPACAEDVGKSSTDFPERTTTYPRESHGLLGLAVTAPSGWRLHAYLHGWEMKTAVESITSVVNDSLDFGARWESAAEINDAVSLEYGLESFNRRGVDAVSPDEPRSLDGATLDELGAFAAAGSSRGKASWQAGGRFSWVRQRNGPDTGRNLSAWNGFAELSWLLAEKLEMRGSVDSGLRFPSLSELFYTGTTGRGARIIGNPELGSERSLNAELSLRWLGKRLYVNAVVFRNRVKDYIERIVLEVEPDLFTYDNLTSGTIEGLEVQGLFIPAERWRIIWAGHLLRGRSASNVPLADIPADEASVGLSHDVGRWTIESRLAYRSEKTDLGAGEKEEPIPSAYLLSASAGFAISSRWRIAFSGDNLLDEEYFPSADRKAPLAEGRSFTVRLSWGGRGGVP